ncbi:MAG: hypothetical protein GY851_04420 [bacterium]|nr:hypothetical protein [bacterium]
MADDKGFGVAKIVTCPRCEQQSLGRNQVVCDNCEDKEYEDYSKVLNTLEQYPEATATEAAELAEVEIECVLRMVDRGRVVNSKDLKAPVCGKCGKPAINHKKRICSECLHKLESDLRGHVKELQEHLQGKRMFDVHDAVAQRKQRTRRSRKSDS